MLVLTCFRWERFFVSCSQKLPMFPLRQEAEPFGPLSTKRQRKIPICATTRLLHYRTISPRILTDCLLMPIRRERLRNFGVGRFETVFGSSWCSRISSCVPCSFCGARDN